MGAGRLAQAAVSAIFSTAGLMVVVTVGPAAGSVVPAPPAVYQPPVDAPIVDPFRAPSSPYGPGNRGVDYAVAAGTEVKAAGAGRVTFAGPVGGHLHVVVLHSDGVRTSYSFLVSVAVGKGQGVAAGQVLGTASVSFHFGARVGDTYIDPLALLAGRGAGRPRLVPDQAEGGGGPVRAVSERRALRDLAQRPRGSPTPVPARAVAWARLPLTLP